MREEKLAGYFKEIYSLLREGGVPEDRLPTPWHVMSRVVQCIDPDLLYAWLATYIDLEGEDEDEDDEDEDGDVEGRRKESNEDTSGSYFTNYRGEPVPVSSRSRGYLKMLPGGSCGDRTLDDGDNDGGDGDRGDGDRGGEDG
ncbi:MAG: hypothetical protein GY721_05350 [Deltaproteobacteria bacterium]|nr:hypothetical protein [Deltaproteobacteria bacterium]